MPEPSSGRAGHTGDAGHASGALYYDRHDAGVDRAMTLHAPSETGEKIGVGLFVAVAFAVFFTWAWRLRKRW